MDGSMDKGALVGVCALACACSDYDFKTPADDDSGITDDTTDHREGDGEPEWGDTDWADPAGFDPDTTGTTGIDPRGRVVTILLTLHDAFVSDDAAEDLIVNSVRFVSPVAVPSVIVIADDDMSGEDDDDPYLMADELEAAGMTAVLVEEPSSGIAVDALEGFHVAIFSNPGHPPDDVATIEALRAFSTEGYGIVFQGDDMTRSSTPTLEELTRLHNVDNGEEYYGHEIDNDDGDAYAVRLDPAHELCEGLTELDLQYGNDIDTATLVDSNNIVAGWATVSGTDYPEKPVITAYSR